MKTHLTALKQLLPATITAIAACLLTIGCASTNPGTLSDTQLAGLRKTKAVLIQVDGVDGKQKEFFVNSFKEQLAVNGVTSVTSDGKDASKSEYDAVISLKCYYFDYGQFSLGRASDLKFAHGPRSAIGVGKRIGCRFELTHKSLGKLFAGTIQGTTKLEGRMGNAEFEQATTTADAFSAYLEQNAQQAFDADLKRSRGWLYVLNMRPKG